MTLKIFGALSVPVALCATLLTAANPDPGSAASPADRNEAQPPAQVAISGIINDAVGGNFRLDYGAGEIVIDLAGWEWLRQADVAKSSVLSFAERVTITGPADEEFYDDRRLQAETIYVEDRDTFYTRSWSQRSDGPWEVRSMPVPPLYGARAVTIRLAGKVAAVDGQQFSLQVGDSTVRVDTRGMIDSPLDKTGAGIAVGDWVQVGGKLDRKFFDDRRLKALRVTRIVGGGADAF